MTQPPPPLTELKLPPTLKEAINTAFARFRPICVGYVSEDRRPELSFRGSTQAYSDTQLAIWVRTSTGGIIGALAGNPNISLLYGDVSPTTRAFITFRGRGRVDNSEATRRVVYGGMHERERARDPEQKGVPLIIDLESVDGIFADQVLQMRR